MIIPFSQDARIPFVLLADDSPEIGSTYTKIGGLRKIFIQFGCWNHKKLVEKTEIRIIIGLVFERMFLLRYIGASSMVGHAVGIYSGINMKGIFSSFVFFGTMLGFTSQWIGKKAPAYLQEIQEQQEAQEIKVNPGTIEILDSVNMVDKIGEFFPDVSERINAETSLYPAYDQLKKGDLITVEYRDEIPSRFMVHRSKYEQMRIEMFPLPSVIIDTLPLDAKSIVFSFSVKQLLAPTDELLEIFELEPGILGVIDNHADIIKELRPSDNIEVLAVGRYKYDSLQHLDEILSLRINQEEESTLLFKYSTEQEALWFSEDLTECSFPFLRTPTDHILISSLYGVMRGEKVHKGIDFAAQTGTPIYASASGVVTKAGWGTGYGLMAKINHDHLGEFETLYAHMSRRYVHEGQYVRQGELIGLVGSTGKSTGPHLHYEVQHRHHKVNPRGRSLSKIFKPKNIDTFLLENYRDSIDKIFVQASIQVIDLSELVAQN
jgi:murein DD-endopeptidase MepM/ murein hydrolase activator NlpD